MHRKQPFRSKDHLPIKVQRMKSFLLGSFVLVSTVLFVSCNKEVKEPSGDPFPNQVGDHWEYLYNDGSDNRDLQINVDIVGTGKLPDGSEATIWNTTLHLSADTVYLIDSVYVVENNQEVFLFHAPCWTCTQKMPDEWRSYIRPLHVNSYWYNQAPWGDTTRVLSQEDITVPAGTFPNTFKLIHKVGYAVNSYTNDTIWLTPNIGMTKYSQNEFSLGPLPGNGTWELTNYSLK